MAAVVTDQFRILNAENFVNSVLDSNNSYYVFLGLSNPTDTGFGGRKSDWDTNIPQPVDNLSYTSHYRDTSLFGKKITSSNVRRVVKKVDWVENTPFDMYRHDYQSGNTSPVSESARLYNSNYYVVTSEFKVYLCIDNGSTGLNPTVGNSLYEPSSTDIEPFQAGPQDDGYRWKYLFTIVPSDIIKFDSTEFIVIPNDWATSTDTQIEPIRDGGDSTIYSNQIKKVYIENGGVGYTNNASQSCDILGDGSAGKVLVETNESGTIDNISIINGGKNYTYGIIDLRNLGTPTTKAKLIPIIPPSRGHGYDVYQDLGADRVMIYTRFDESTKDFPISTQFAQIGILKNPEMFSSESLYTSGTFSSLFSIKLSSSYAGTPFIGGKITQTQGSKTAKGYIASYDSTTKVLKYYQDRSLYFQNALDHTDGADIETVLPFISTANVSVQETAGGSTSSVSIDTSLTDTSSITIDNKQIDLSVSFTNGLANPEINKRTGDVLYIDNRPLIERDIRQKEDVKIILEF